MENREIAILVPKEDTTEVSGKNNSVHYLKIQHAGSQTK